jgi:hypothetical protein
MGISTTPTIVSTRRNLGATLHGPLPTVDRFGRAEQACEFDGVDDYVEVPHDPSLSLQKEYSLVVTFKTTAYPSTASGVVSGNGTVLTMHVLEKKGSFRATLLQLVNRPPYQPYMLYGHGTGKVPLWNTLILANRYYQLAFMYANRTLHVAINGEIKEEIPNMDEPIASTESLILGNSASPEEYYYSRKFFKGVIDRVQTFDWVLSKDELTRLYQSDTL